jgi:hypothetical protein
MSAEVVSVDGTGVEDRDRGGGAGAVSTYHRRAAGGNGALRLLPVRYIRY